MMDSLDFLIAPVATLIVLAAGLMAMHWRDTRVQPRPVRVRPADRPQPPR